MALPERAADGDTEQHEGTPHDGVDFIVVDVETTGTGAVRGDRVTEVAAVRVQGRVIEPVFHSLVNPGRPIPYFITSLTGIDDAMVRDAPEFADVAGELAAHLAGRVFVAHNAAFDWGFLDAEFARIAVGDPRAFESLVRTRLCTVRLARRLLRHLPRRNLDAVCFHYGISNDGRHRAAGDARATAHVLVHLLADAERAGMWSLESLTRLAAVRRPRRRALPTWTEGADGA
jgi:DNA polymerase-3 subunit epsilon